MEILFELLGPVLEFVAEIALQVAFEWLAEFGFRGVQEVFQQARREVRPELAAAGYAMLGAIAGAISLLIFPSSFISSRAGRIANLAVTPLCSGAAMMLLGKWRSRRGQVLVRLDRFAYGLAFAFAMTAVRFVFARHGG